MPAGKTAQSNDYPGRVKGNDFDGVRRIVCCFVLYLITYQNGLSGEFTIKLACMNIEKRSLGSHNVCAGDWY